MPFLAQSLKLVASALLLVCSLSWAEEQSAPIYVLDLDGTILEAKEDIPLSVPDSPEFFRVNNENYRYAPFTWEFLMALERSAKRPPQYALFSAGFSSRNEAAARALRIRTDTSFMSQLSAILSFDELTPVHPIPDGISRENLVEFIHKQPGKGGVEFFDIFTKDLDTVFGVLGRPPSYSDVLMFEDNPYAVRPANVGNIIALARAEFNDEELVRPGSQLPQPRRRVGENLNPVQVARAKYRLVRAIGLLDLAKESVALGKYPNDPSAVDALQWDGNGKFRSRLVNSRSIYERGMKLLKIAYDAENDPVMKRTPNYFQFGSEFSEKSNCAPLLSQIGSALPWDPINPEE